MYKESLEDPVAFWGKLAKEYHWEQQVGGTSIYLRAVTSFLQPSRHFSGCKAAGDTENHSY